MTPQLFVTWRHGGIQFLAFDNGNGGVSVVDEHGKNYGAWMDVSAFRDRQRRHELIAQPIDGSVVGLQIVCRKSALCPA